MRKRNWHCQDIITSMCDQTVVLFQLSSGETALFFPWIHFVIFDIAVNFIMHINHKNILTVRLFLNVVPAVHKSSTKAGSTYAYQLTFYVSDQTWLLFKVLCVRYDRGGFVLSCSHFSTSVLWPGVSVTFHLDILRLKQHELIFVKAMDEASFMLFIVIFTPNIIEVMDNLLIKGPLEISSFLSTVREM